MLPPPKIFVVSNMYVRDQLIKYVDETENPNLEEYVNVKNHFRLLESTTDI